MATVNLLGPLALEATQQDLGAKLDAGNGVRQAIAMDADQTAAAADEIVMLLESILSRLGWPDQSTGSIRVLAAGGSLGTVTTVTTVSTVTNQAQMAGFSTVYDQYAAMLSCAAANRARITVT